MNIKTNFQFEPESLNWSIEQVPMLYEDGVIE